LTIHGSYWERSDGSSGFKAYLNRLYVTLVEDAFTEKYGNIPHGQR
jgi:hypothetical protein